MLNANESIRNLCRHKHVPLWAVAYAEGVSEFTLIRRLRVELTDVEKARLTEIIEQIAREEIL